MSESEEMYLVTIRRICEHCTDTPVSIPEIAKELGVQPVSANQMINKLAETGMVKYVPYKGVELTPEGRAISTRILRHRRLWEVFFVKVLKMELDEADQLACQVEHFTPPDVANRLSEFLENPTVCFHGDPIPLIEEGKSGAFEGIPLEHLKVGQSSPVIRIETDTVTKKFLADEGVQPGVRIRVLAIGNKGDRLLEARDHHIHLSAEVIDAIVVSSAVLISDTRSKEHTMSIPLSNLKVGEKGVIQKVNFKGAIRQRLLAMGLVIGETILVKRTAPLGDPIDYVIKGYDLSLRKVEAKEIFVTPLAEGI